MSTGLRIFEYALNCNFRRDTVASVGSVISKTLPFVANNVTIKTFRHALSLDEVRRPVAFRLRCIEIDTRRRSIVPSSAPISTTAPVLQTSARTSMRGSRMSWLRRRETASPPKPRASWQPSPRGYARASARVLRSIAAREAWNGRICLLRPLQTLEGRKSYRPVRMSLRFGSQAAIAVSAASVHRRMTRAY